MPMENEVVMRTRKTFINSAAYMCLRYLCVYLNYDFTISLFVTHRINPFGTI